MPATALFKPRSLPRAWLAVEFTAFYLLGPVIMAVLLPPGMLFPVLFALMALGLYLLHITPGFHWSDLSNGLSRVSLTVLLATAAATLAASVLIVTAKVPEALWWLPRERPMFMLLLAALYPLLSALPQEVVYRPLFFQRYGAILPSDPRVAIALNAAVFSLAHLMYWNVIVAAMTLVGGALFAWSYQVRRSFAEAVLAHSIAGIILFAVGMGVFFYSGNVVRPF